ncbi:hypothetical protein IQ219_09550 [Synechocystis sp. LEGE 06083]|uniref:hypothetical protein n=1 Tax=Synechocystis sp. LEGE 06083 TaxID=915336 RepID=UPI00187F2543|nr:hypothetical protein [Synechocystis sp. LEGE 06083]MBE9195540.1 hypothetical protein [Synechocystis sp. LEGE 06083]
MSCSLYWALAVLVQCFGGMRWRSGDRLQHPQCTVVIHGAIKLNPTESRALVGRTFPPISTHNAKLIIVIPNYWIFFSNGDRQ